MTARKGMPDIYKRLKQRVRERLPDGSTTPARGDAAAYRKSLMRAAREVAWEEGFVLDPLEMQCVLERLLEDMLGLGPLEVLVREEEITETMVNGPHAVSGGRPGEAPGMAGEHSG